MKNNEHYIDQGAITVIAPVASPDHLTKLKTILAQIGADEKGGGIIPLEKVGSLHFLRWFIIEDAKITDDHGGYSEENPFPPNLAFTSNFDGPPVAHLEELLAVGKSAIVALYQCCEGFPQDAEPSNASIIQYFKKHTHGNQLFWPAIRGGTVEQLKGESELRTAIEAFINEGQQNGAFEGLSPRGIKENIVAFVKSRPDLAWAMVPRATPSFGWKFRYYGVLALKLALLLPMLLLLGIWFLLSDIFNKRDDEHRKPIIRDQEFETLLSNEDRVFMNQLTVYGGLKKPYWFRLTQLRIGLWIFALNGTYRSNKGKLSGMETIHFARWSLFNKNRNVMFLSNYDGAWQIYLSEFIDRSAAAMNLTFGTTVGYPKVKRLFGLGAHDEQAFKTVVRNNQYPCQVWYSAYPTLTVSNIRNNQQIRIGLTRKAKESAEEWLMRF